MSNLLRFPNNRRDKEEAGQWLARVDRGLTQAEHVELSEWLREPRHREALFRLARDWDSMAVLEELAELFPLSPDEGVSWRFAGRVAVGDLRYGRSVLQPYAQPKRDGDAGDEPCE